MVTKKETLYVVRNTGRHLSFGPGYVWEPSPLTVRPGDKVRWEWNLPVPQEGTGISVHQTASASELGWDGKGFKYQFEKSSKGALVHSFATEGTFYYNTQEVIEDKELFMPGKVIVAAPETD